MKSRAKANPLKVTNQTQGFCRKRRREAAVCAQLSSAYRARRCKRNGILCNLDQSNAFGSTEWAALDDEIKARLWRAPTKGGPFTTHEREIMKSTEFRKANGDA